jgi:hypothetical protein
MYWRFAPVLNFAKTSWVARPILQEARDEIESIARHTKSAYLRDNCFALLRQSSDEQIVNMPAEQAVNEILAGIISAAYAPNCPVSDGTKDLSQDVKVSAR